MSKISVIGGKGNMGSAIAALFERCGNEVEIIGRTGCQSELGEIVVLAVKYASRAEAVAQYAPLLAGKIVIDISNPVDFSTMDNLLVPDGTSAAEQLAELLPDSNIIKGFNINFSDSLADCKVAGNPASLIFAGDNTDAKTSLFKALESSGAKLIDAGGLKRARELESMGLMLIRLAVSGTIDRKGGLVVF